MFEYINLVSLVPVCFLIVCVLQHAMSKSLVNPGRMAYGATSTGILLTFFGIWQGLIGFDVVNTEESIPQLLEGLKIAFSSSVFGLFSALVINLLFVRVEKSEENDIASAISSLSKKMDSFTTDLTSSNILALGEAIEKVVKQLELGINSETRQSIEKFRDAIDMLREWQEKYIDEIKVITDAMDKNAIVTKETSEQLDKTNLVLKDLKPVTETIAESIGWVQHALPSFRKKSISRNSNPDDKK